MQGLTYEEAATLLNVDAYDNEVRLCSGGMGEQGCFRAFPALIYAGPPVEVSGCQASNL